jgi:hypothetical protein
VQGWIGGRPRIICRALHSHHRRHRARLAEGKGGSAQCPIIGRPSLKLTIEAEDEHGDRRRRRNATAAARIVHAIPFVCGAAGLLDALAVPLPVGRGLLGLTSRVALLRLDGR